MKASIVSASLFAAAVSAHGNITSPPARQAGAAMAAVCGQDAVDTVNSDPTIPLEDVTAATTQCDLGLCRGAQFEDNANQVQQFAPGEVVPIEAIIPIPHEGPMNTSIVDTATNTVIGQPLISFDSYADENLAVLPANNTNFSVTMPTDLPANQCAVAGECVMQWFWFGTNAQQTYESCIDFVMVQ
ncbi:hypothetical protein KVR01_005182 [Diaporthe batatas]|uniref:uncharacterized protein n=1 Tax=Diaporthe batatas TaxID=748121 RepID=UPI001D042078|nr:uncharacterized protein KVR01_005182 [Diaporthe batatas]KAG8164907.1 hypothetical protein KVR01_005182 [Diaporthe batatas]